MVFEYRYCFFESESFKIEELVDSETNEPEFALYANKKLLLPQTNTELDRFGINLITF